MIQTFSTIVLYIPSEQENRSRCSGACFEACSEGIVETVDSSSYYSAVVDSPEAEQLR